MKTQLSTFKGKQLRLCNVVFTPEFSKEKNLLKKKKCNFFFHQNYKNKIFIKNSGANIG